MVMPIDNFDADDVLRDHDDNYSFEDEVENEDEEEVQELELGNPHKLHDLDISEEDDLYT